MDMFSGPVYRAEPDQKRYFITGVYMPDNRHRRPRVRLGRMCRDFLQCFCRQRGITRDDYRHVQ